MGIIYFEITFNLLTFSTPLKTDNPSVGQLPENFEMMDVLWPEDSGKQYLNNLFNV